MEKAYFLRRLYAVQHCLTNDGIFAKSLGIFSLLRPVGADDSAIFTTSNISGVRMKGERSLEKKGKIQNR